MLILFQKQLAGAWGLVIAFISAPGTFFISNDGFYFGVLPVLAEAGRSYGFDNMSMAFSFLNGASVPLIKSISGIYLLAITFNWFRYGPMAKESAKYALGIFRYFRCYNCCFRSHAFIYSTKLNVVAETVGSAFSPRFFFFIFVFFLRYIFIFLILYLLSIKK